MGRINREITFEHDGKKYAVTASIRFMMGLDRDLQEFSGNRTMAVLTRMEKAARAAAQDPDSELAADLPIFELAFIIAEVMREAGVKIDDEDVYEDLLTDMQGGGVYTASVVEQFFKVLAPPESVEKNSAAPKEAGAKKRKQPARK